MGERHYSEMLGPLVRGELDDATTNRVREHLTACELCRAELTAVQALATTVEPLTDLEKAAVRKHIWATIGTNATGSTPADRPWRARLAPFLGAAAVVVVMAVGFVALQTSTGGDSDDAGSNMLDADAGGGDASTEEGSSGNGGSSAAEGSVETTEDQAFMYSGGVPVALPDLGELTSADIHELGRASPFTGFRDAYDRAFARRHADEFLEMLAASSPRPERVLECGEAAARRSGSPGLAVISAEATFEGSPVLLVGFAHDAPSTEGAALDGYVIWLFTEPGCTAAAEFSGAI